MINVMTKTDEKLINEIPKCNAKTYTFCCHITAAAPTSAWTSKKEILIIESGLISLIYPIFFQAVMTNHNTIIREIADTAR